VEKWKTANANGKNSAINNNLNISWSGHKNELASRCQLKPNIYNAVEVGEFVRRE